MLRQKILDVISELNNSKLSPEAESCLKSDLAELLIRAQYSLPFNSKPEQLLAAMLGMVLEQAPNLPKHLKNLSNQLPNNI